MAHKKSAEEKLNSAKPAYLTEMPPKWVERYGPGNVLIPNPVDFAEELLKIPEGSVATIENLREYIAKKAGATLACPLCSGIFWRITADATEKRRVNGGKLFPYWRLVKADGKLNDKLTHQRALLEAEGIPFTGQRVNLAKVKIFKYA
jgi:alkylated DNA nucleotide flippase Atl1